MLNCTKCEHYDVCKNCGRTKNRNGCLAFEKKNLDAEMDVVFYKIPQQEKPEKRKVVFYNTGRGGYYWYADE